MRPITFQILQSKRCKNTLTYYVFSDFIIQTWCERKEIVKLLWGYIWFTFSSHSSPLNLFTSQNIHFPHNIHTSLSPSLPPSETLWHLTSLSTTLFWRIPSLPFFNARFLHHRTMQVHTFFFSLFCKFQKRKLKLSFRRVNLLFYMAYRNLFLKCYDRAFNSAFEY